MLRATGSETILPSFLPSFPGETSQPLHSRLRIRQVAKAKTPYLSSFVVDLRFRFASQFRSYESSSLHRIDRVHRRGGKHAVSDIIYSGAYKRAKTWRQGDSSRSMNLVRQTRGSIERSRFGNNGEKSIVYLHKKLPRFPRLMATRFESPRFSIEPLVPSPES